MLHRQVIEPFPEFDTKVRTSCTNLHIFEFDGFFDQRRNGFLLSSNSFRSRSLGFEPAVSTMRRFPAGTARSNREMRPFEAGALAKKVA
jgi:hypothetical protein